MMPAAHVRLSAGREAMSDELQALCFIAGANSMFYGEKLLTTGNPDVERDQQLFARLGLEAERTAEAPDRMTTVLGAQRRCRTGSQRIPLSSGCSP